MNKKKIAFIHYTNFPLNARFETMPFAFNCVVALANAGWEVDVYLWEQPSSTYDNLLPGNVTLRYFVEPQVNRLTRVLGHVWLRFKFQWQSNYCCVFGVGQRGSYIAAVIARSSQCPFIYLNDEFPSTWSSTWFKSRWSQLEQQVVRDAAIIIVPDIRRFYPLCQELNIAPSKKHAFLPNAPVIQPSFKDINWHEKLGLPKDSIPFLHAGAITDWAQVTEILSSVPYWPEEAVLVLHSHSSEHTDGTTRKYFSHLDVPNKVFWSSQPLTINYLNSLVSYCEANFALYRNTEPNLEYMGFSSGKLMRSLACGRPVIASNLPSLSFVREHNLGVLVTHPAEIPNAVKQIMQDRESYKSRCLSFLNSHASVEKYWEEFCEQLMQIKRIDLRRPTI